MRNESIDLTEIIRRMEEGIYDHEEYAKAMAWTEKYCKVNEGEDFKNRPEKRKNREQKDADWEFVVKMMIIMRDLMTKAHGIFGSALGENSEIIEKIDGVSDQWALKTVWGVGYKFEVR